MTIKKKTFSIIVPVYNDPIGLKETLDSLVKQDSPKDSFEIIVADNGSGDDTLSIIKRFIRKYPETIRIVQEKQIQSSYAARNKGIKAARGLVICFIDADMTVKNDWLSNINQIFNNNNLVYMGCKVEIILKKRTLSGLYNKMLAFPVEFYISELNFAPTCCLTVLKDIFSRIGLFNENLISGGDHEFGNRVSDAGYKVHFESNLAMRHPARYTLKQLLKKSFRIGRGAKQMSFYYPERYNMGKTKIFNPRYFFPIKALLIFAWTMRKNDLWNSLNCPDKLLIILIHWGYLLTHHLGYIYESLFGNLKHEKRNKNEGL
jgi:glycosyltransferase involved in cell wall biosynthesis